MNNKIPYRKRLNGFTLVEMAIVIFIAGILLTAGLKLLTVKLNAAQLEATHIHQEAIKQALISYLGKNQRLPCPATVANGGLPSPSPLPQCTSYSGIVPYYVLGLDRAVVLDGWGNFITYVVSPNPIATPPTMPYTTAWLYSYSPTLNAYPYTTNNTIAFWPSISTGGIKITDGTNSIANPAIATGAAAVLISYGKNGYGAFNVKGGTNDSSTAGTDELQNISPVTTGPPSTATVVKRDTTDSTAGGGAFDDEVMTMSANDLVGPLIANGTLQANAQAALNQANDIVMGNIVATKTMCPPLGGICTNPAYYYTIPNMPVFPASVTAWGILYTQGSTTISATSSTPTTASTAYTLTAGDGKLRTVLITELRGLLNRSPGFN